MHAPPLVPSRSGKHGVYFFEQGPRSLLARPASVCALTLLHELGLRRHVLKANSTAQVRFVYKDGELQRLPTGPLSALLSPLVRPALGGALRNWWHGRGVADALRAGIDASRISEADDMSVGAFVASRINSHTAENLLDPLVAGIWSGDVNRLSVFSCFPMLPLGESASPRGSFVHGMLSGPKVPPATASAADKPAPGVLFRPPIDEEAARFMMSDAGLVGSTFTFRHGLQMFPEALLAGLQRHKNVQVRLETSVSEISVTPTSVRARVGGQLEEFDKVFWTTSAPALLSATSAASISSPPSPVSSLPLELATDLRAFEYGSVAIVHVAFPKNVLPRQFRGFGFLVPSAEHTRAINQTPEAKLALDGLLGVTFDSVTFPDQNFSRQEYERLTNPDMHDLAVSAAAATKAPSADDRFEAAVERHNSQLRLTVMLGGARFPHIAALSPADWEARARAVVKHILRIDEQPDAVRAHCARQGIPQPNVGHMARLVRVHSAVSAWSGGRVELGGMVNGVSVPDCVMNACRAATNYAIAVGSPSAKAL